MACLLLEYHWDRTALNSSESKMKRKLQKSLVATSALAVALFASAPAFCQETTTPSGEMHAAGSDAKGAASKTADAATHAYRGVKESVKDAAVTAKVKTALHNNKVVGNSDVHVSTNGGVVTLRGEVPNREAAATAEQIAQETSGVKRVNNELTVMSASTSGSTSSNTSMR
jgi:hyperosmotically inducible protein